MSIVDYVKNYLKEGKQSKQINEGSDEKTTLLNKLIEDLPEEELFDLIDSIEDHDLKKELVKHISQKHGYDEDDFGVEKDLEDKMAEGDYYSEGDDDLDDDDLDIDDMKAALKKDSKLRDELKDFLMGDEDDLDIDDLDDLDDFDLDERKRDSGYTKDGKYWEESEDELEESEYKFQKLKDKYGKKRKYSKSEPGEDVEESEYKFQKLKDKYGKKREYSKEESTDELDEYGSDLKMGKPSDKYKKRREESTDELDEYGSDLKMSKPSDKYKKRREESNSEMERKLEEYRKAKNKDM